MIQPNYNAIHQRSDIRCDHSGQTMWFDRPGSYGDLMGIGPGEFCEHCVVLRGFDIRKVVDLAIGDLQLVSPNDVPIDPSLLKQVTCPNCYGVGHFRDLYTDEIVADDIREFTCLMCNGAKQVYVISLDTLSSAYQVSTE